MAILPMWKTIARALFRKPATRKTPIVFERTRGQIENDVPSCIFCGICQRRCPTGAIKVDRAARTWAIARFDCMQCNCCAEACPKKCLTMTNTPPAAMDTQTWVTLQGAPEPPKPPKADAPKAAETAAAVTE